MSTEYVSIQLILTIPRVDEVLDIPPSILVKITKFSNISGLLLKEVELRLFQFYKCPGLIEGIMKTTQIPRI